MTNCSFFDTKNTLSKAKLFAFYKVIKINNNLNLKVLRRLAEVGLYPDTTLQLIRNSLKKRTYLIAFNSFVVSVQKEIADAIEVQEL